MHFENIVHQVVNKLLRIELSKKMVAAIFNTQVHELQSGGQQIGIQIHFCHSLLQAAHSLLGRNFFASDYIGDLKPHSYI